MLQVSVSRQTNGLSGEGNEDFLGRHICLTVAGSEDNLKGKEERWSKWSTSSTLELVSLSRRKVVIERLMESESRLQLGLRL